MNRIFKINKIKKELRNAYISVFIMIILLLESSFIAVNTIYPLPSFVFYLPFYTTLLYIVSIFLVRDLIYYYRIATTYIFILLFIAIICYSYFLVRVGMMQGGIVMWIIFAFLGLFYGTFLWDFFMGLFYSKKILQLYQQRLQLLSEKHKDDRYIYVNGPEFMKPKDIEKKKSILGVVSIVFMLPVALLGKGASYFLGIGLSQYFDAHAYILSAIGFPITLLLVMLFSPFMIAFWRLKYPKV